MPTPERLAEQFEEHRPHMRAVAYRMLGSVSEAEDAVQEAWIRLSRTDVSDVDNLRGWLTTVVARVCLDMLRTRASRREDPLDVHVPDPIIARAIGRGDEGPEADAMLADSVGLALLVVLEKLEPAERLAFVLHDVFAMTFEEIAPIVDRAVVAQAATFSNLASSSQVVLVNGNIGLVARRPDGRLFAVLGFTIAGGRVVEIDILADPDRLSRLDLSAIER